MDEQQSPKKNTFSNIQILLSLTAIVAPVFYLVGLSFYHGLMNTYGVNTDLFNLSIQDIYFSAYIAVLKLLIELKNFVLTSLISWQGLTTLLGIFILIIALTNIYIHQNKIKEHKRLSWAVALARKINSFFSLDKPSFGGTVTFSSLITFLIANFIALAATIFSLWAIPSTIGYSMGVAAASKKVDIYLEKGCYFERDTRWSNCRTLKSKNGETIYKGILVSHSENLIAFFTKDGAITTQVPDGAILINEINSTE